MDINFELYKIFYHAATTGSFSIAANRLFITQSAVSQAIKNLETRLGTQLFFRKTRHLKLTREGELLLSHVEQAYNLLKSAESKMAELQDLQSGTIQVGASDTICKYFLIPYLQEFNRRYPKLKMKVINRTSAQILEILKNGALDFGIVTLPLNDPLITTHVLTAVEDILVAAPHFSELRHRTLSLGDLAGYPLLFLEKTSATRRNFDAYLSSKALSVTPELELESVDLLVEFARIGLGIAHVQRESASTLIAAGELFEVKVEEGLPLRHLGIAALKNVPFSKAAECFIAMLMNETFT
ncbi:DNA-binding transcriptional LysR family regulator [Hydrogenispora ethanolica]|jgi:DNA-binding transcriptional LysR family regulator|uniref:DNA-binding transcriptional LysR family regulator n=1 Tax=Hydrogenispora ethanolica TaxID=1082276 RepID=A0A4R1RS86_HYDET|nr:LysR family transcriptional regulator [Hydrogenispora ethanolica]TCL69323.1 DNA-binding transcriptional LysR family regulator [Hydrogenispora ethanolica]